MNDEDRLVLPDRALRKEFNSVEDAVEALRRGYFWGQEYIIVPAIKLQRGNDETNPAG